MGVSTDAILFWGIVIDNESELHERITEESTAGPEGEPAEGTLAFQHYMGDEDGGCTLGTHCSGDCPMHYVMVSESKTRARRGYPEEITSLKVKPDWEPKLRDFCTKYNVPWGEPKWWLVSYWG